MKKRILALLLALTLLVLGGCTVRDMVQVVGVSTTTLQELADAALSDETEAPESGDQFVTAESPAEPPEEAPQVVAAPADEVSETAARADRPELYRVRYQHRRRRFPRGRAPDLLERRAVFLHV